MIPGAAHLLRGISSCGKSIIGDALRQQEAAHTIQRVWKTRRPQQPPSRKKRRIACTTRHWFWGAVWSNGRPDRAAAAKLMLDELRDSADISLQIRFIRVWVLAESNDYPIEWAAILREVLSMLPANEVLAVCKNFLWSRLCRLAATAKDSNAAGAYASVIISLTLHSEGEDGKDDTILRNKELLWKDEEAYSDLLRAWNTYPALYGSIVDPETSCYVLQNKISSDPEDEVFEDVEDDHKPMETEQQRCTGTDDEEEMMPNNEGENTEVEASNNPEEAEADDDEDSCGEENNDGDEDEEEEDDDEDGEDHYIDDVSTRESDDEMIVEGDEVQEITIRGSDTNVAEHTTDDEIRKERRCFIIRCSMKVLRESYSELLLNELLDVVIPPSKPSQTKVLIRRAPSQEEYFRGSITHNPLDIDMLEGTDPTVEDLRQYIARELHMADSTELIEILVANQILSPNLKLRLVNQLLWKKHLIEGNGSGAVFSSGTISILWTTNKRVTSSTPLSALPPIVATYRLIGVDGEATEDKVESLGEEKDEEGPTDEEINNIRQVDPRVILRCTTIALEKLVVQIQRDRVDNGPACGDTIPSSVALFKQCCSVHSEKFVLEGAPTTFLHYLLRLFKVQKESCAVTAMLQSLIELLTTNISLAPENVEQQRKQLSSLLDSIDKLDLPVHLCELVAKLLPFLTYGQSSLSRELAQQIDRHINVDILGLPEETTLAKTLVHMIVHLPRNDSCDRLRAGLYDCGLGRRLSHRFLQGFPKTPPSWTSALWKKKSKSSASNVDSWKQYYESAPIVSLLLRLMNGLGRLGASSELVKALHWLEATSDSSGVETHGLGLLSETLLDNLVEVVDSSKQKIAQYRKTTRERKKEISLEKRSQALVKLKLGSTSNSTLTTTSLSKKGNSKKNGKNASPKIPDWMAEADQMEDETGLTCAVCQEGRSLQPKEMLGLYAFVSKVTLGNEKCGAKEAISGLQLLKRLPAHLPSSLHGSILVDDWFSSAKAGASELTLHTTSSRRTTTYTTSVSAGTGIHLSCHRRARTVDRNHPKAPKSEWSGAALRNNRVSCNIILPLISPLSSNTLPIDTVESALAEYHSSVSNLLGAAPPSMLWSALYDTYFLLLRIAYNEDLSSDCGGGSLASNCELLFYQLIAADTFDRQAQAENISHSTHARCLPSGLLAALALINEDGSSYDMLSPFVGDSAVMSTICSLVFHNCTESTENQLRPFPKRQWMLGRDFFFRALLITAGRRHFMGINGSGCSSEGSSRVYDIDYQSPEAASSGDKCSVDVIAPFLHPLLVLFGIMDHLSNDFSPAMTDEAIRDSSERLVALLKDCHSTRSIPDLTHRLKISCREDDIISYFRKGVNLKSVIPSDV